MIFQDDKARRYLEGEWLEDLVFETVRTAGFDSYATNVALAWQDTPEREMNEIDVAVVHKLHFFYLTCKAGSDPEQMKNHLFELETLSELPGGLFNHPILVASSARAVPLHLRRRTATLGITYVGPADLPQLASRLKEIIR
jgi:Card1-like, endonuclease domain